MAKRSKKSGGGRKTAVSPAQEEKLRRLKVGNIVISFLFLLYVIWRIYPTRGLVEAVAWGIGLGLLTWLVLYGVGRVTRGSG